jgi:hypothetical protein
MTTSQITQRPTGNVTPSQPFVRSQAFGDQLQPSASPQSSSEENADDDGAGTDTAFEDEFEIPAFLRQK